VFLAYLAGTWASSRAGAEASRFGRKAVLLVSVAVMVAGVAITLSNNVIAVLVGLVIATAGFFGAHSIAAGWTGRSAAVGKAQASSLYNGYGWTAVAVTIMALAAIAAAAAALFLPAD
jgi:MFS family permease